MRMPRLQAVRSHTSLRPVAWVTDAFSAWLERFFAVQAVDRAVAIGAQAFSALFPLLIVYSAVAPRSEASDFAQRIIGWLRLSGASAQSVREALAPPSGVTQSITALGLLLTIVSALSLARTLQRLYERCYDLPAAGVRGTPWHLLWILLVPVYISLRPVVSDIAGGWWHLAASLGLGLFMWLLTPYVLLAKRLEWQALLPTAILTAIAMTALSAVSVIYLPHSITSSAEQFGTIGVAFALLGWLVVMGFVLAGSATAGSVVADHVRGRSDQRRGRSARQPVAR